MASPRTPIRINLTDDERVELGRRSRSQADSHRRVTRARMVLLLADGSNVTEVARTVGCPRFTVRKWGNRFALQRMTGLEDRARSGRPRTSCRRASTCKKAGWPRGSIRLTLTAEERAELQRSSRSQTATHRSVKRAKIIMLLSDGMSVAAVARTVDGSTTLVRRWAKRFEAKRVSGLEDRPRSGRPAVFSPGGRDASGQTRL